MDIDLDRSSMSLIKKGDKETMRGMLKDGEIWPPKYILHS
jgi:hypothetical protein